MILGVPDAHAAPSANNFEKAQESCCTDAIHSTPQWHQSYMHAKT